jgi:alkanesulfonate monooxygenase SsuD/methylene tetrahydromethanopterin reductase-like flavin-dependent oxidoreductase (luciferase family)
VNLPSTHPAAVAAQIAMLDHLLDGRLIFGISPGGLLSDAEAFGTLDLDRGAMFVESINHVLDIWRGEPPYDLKGKFWTISTARTMLPEIGQGFLPKPLQRPHPPIVVTVVAPFSKGVVEAAARGWEPISANFLMPVWVKSHWQGYVEGCGRVGRNDQRNGALPERLRRNDAVARDYAMGPDSPYRFYYSQLLTKMKHGRRLELFKTHRDMPDDEVTLDMICEKLIIHGSPAKVTEEILAFREETGAFGTLLYAGHDWRDRDLARRSMILAAEKVLPAVNAAIGGAG